MRGPPSHYPPIRVTIDPTTQRFKGRTSRLPPYLTLTTSWSSVGLIGSGHDREPSGSWCGKDGSWFSGVADHGSWCDRQPERNFIYAVSGWVPWLGLGVGINEGSAQPNRHPSPGFPSPAHGVACHRLRVNATSRTTLSTAYPPNPSVAAGITAATPYSRSRAERPSARGMSIPMLARTAASPTGRWLASR